jgi:NaMN:DMB phosphoribosyltransferase
MSHDADLATIGAGVEWTDQAAAATVRERLASVGELGQLVELAEWLATTSGGGTIELSRPRIVCFGAEASSGSVVADQLGIGRCVVVPPASATFDRPAVDRAVAVGVAAADDEVDSGADLLVAAVAVRETVAASIVSVLTNTEPVKVLTRGAAATDPDAWMQRAVQVRTARRTGFPYREDPAALLAAIGSPELAAAASFILQAAVRRTPLVLDGLGALTAALLAYEVQPRTVRWWRVADHSPSPASELALTRLALRPVLDLGLGEVGDGPGSGVGAGTTGALVIPILRAALAALAGAPAAPASPHGPDGPDGSDGEQVPQ